MVDPKARRAVRSRIFHPCCVFLEKPGFIVPKWVSFPFAAGTAAGGWRIIRTLGHRMVKLQPVHGFVAETTAAVIIQAASSWGIPALDHARHFDVYHGRWRGETLQRCEVGNRRPNRLGVGINVAGNRGYRLPLARLAQAF